LPVSSSAWKVWAEVKAMLRQDVKAASSVLITRSEYFSDDDFSSALAAAVELTEFA